MKVYSFPEESSPVGTYAMLVTDLLEAPVVHTGEWQSMDTGASKAHATHELEDVSLVWDRIPSDIDSIFPAVDQSWADDHFLERVRGVPYNPPPSHVNWPYAVRGNADHTRCRTCDSPDPRTHPAVGGGGEVTSLCPDPFHSGQTGKFDHTYPERFWPQHAGHDHTEADLWSDSDYRINPDVCGGREGIRFHLGDLSDVVDLLVRSPLTRQAYLPVWFPEDTGAVDGQRVPCTLGYHFMQRGSRLTCRYYIRSCDVYRHLSNDVWFAAMLTKWIAREVNDRTRGQSVGLHFRPGGLIMHISSLHAFVGDLPKIKTRLDGVLA